MGVEVFKGGIIDKEDWGVPKEAMKDTDSGTEYSDADSEQSHVCGVAQDLNYDDWERDISEEMLEENLKSLPCQNCSSGGKGGNNSIVPESFLQVDDSCLAPLKDPTIPFVANDTLEFDCEGNMVQAKVDSVSVLNLRDMAVDSLYLANVHYEEERGGVGVLAENDVKSFRPKRMKTLLFLQGSGAIPRSSQQGTTSKFRGRKPKGVTSVKPLELSLSGLSIHDSGIEHCNVVLRQKGNLEKEDVAAKLLGIGKAVGLTLQGEDEEVLSCLKEMDKRDKEAMASRRENILVK
ncbi:hypothetical protein RIF29_09587 [Crotalaria pallida]|uniref:Uncharacterized protein n=1 Tax=Crotalaria pallida TaxID=3830 RepID=A0AAN9FRX7_CROPI